jgi:hypothetical protein
MNALLSLLLQLLLLLLSRDMDFAIERSDGDDDAAIAKECRKRLIRCVASGFLPPSSFPLLPFSFPLCCPSMQKKEQNERKKERKRLSR